MSNQQSEEEKIKDLAAKEQAERIRIFLKTGKYPTEPIKIEPKPEPTPKPIETTKKIE